MSKCHGKVTLSDEYFANPEMKQCSELVNRMTASDVRVLMYIKKAVSENYYSYFLYEEESIHNLLLLELKKYRFNLNHYFNSLIEKNILILSL